MCDRWYDRWYEQQAAASGKKPQKLAKPKRLLKKDIIAEINALLPKKVSGLDKCLTTTLNELLEAIKEKC